MEQEEEKAKEEQKKAEELEEQKAQETLKEVNFDDSDNTVIKTLDIEDDNDDLEDEKETEIDKVKYIAEKTIKQDNSTFTYDETGKEMPIEEAKAMGAMALFSEKYGDTVRVVKAGDFSTELCGGTHVENTGKIGIFKILAESSVAAGVRRIEAVTGANVMKFIDSKLNLINDTAAALKAANANDLATKAQSVMADLKAKEKEIEKLSGVLANIKTESMLSRAKQVGNVMLVTAFLDDTTPDELRNMCDLVKSKGDNFVGVIAGVQKAKGTGNICVCCGKEAVAAGAHSGNLAREVAKLAGGSGGGKPDSAMAGAKDINALPEAVNKAEELLAGMLK